MNRSEAGKVTVIDAVGGALGFLVARLLFGLLKFWVLLALIAAIIIGIGHLNRAQRMASSVQSKSIQLTPKTTPIN
jgi:hypothetical protein